MNAPPHNLTQEHCDCLNRVINQSHGPIQLAQACVDCGLPFEEILTALRQQQDMATRLKATLFPDRS